MRVFLVCLFCIICSIVFEANGGIIDGDVKMEFCDEYGSSCSEKNLYQTLMWIRFELIAEPKQSFWLKIKKKDQNDYPILIKSMTDKSYNYSTRSPYDDCHFVAASHLVGSEHSDILFKDGISLVGGHDYLPISLCDGISGIAPLADERGLMRIESVKGSQSKLAHLTQIPRLLTEDVSEMKGYDQLKNAADGALYRRNKRVKRSFRMPVHNMPGPFLVELYLIVDSKMASMYHEDNYSRLLSRIKSIMNQINVAFMQFNIYFTVVQLEIWELDQIKLTDENHIIMELQLYKRQFVDKRHDCLHAILGGNLGSARRGQSEPASMCAFSRCVGYTKDHLSLKELEIAHSVMHEIGHNFGLYHDTERCHCVGCIMATGVEFGSLKFQWSNCSRKQMSSLLKSGMADCLRDGPISDLGNFHPIIMSQNKASKTLGGVSMSQCGNGVVDDGEECDCGGRSLCNAAANRCCNPETCRLRSRAYCASGACCDLASCSIRRAGTVCRSVDGRDCDLPEYCDGVSEWCPSDVYKYDGVACMTADVGDSSHCYHGQCNSRKSWCRVLFGDTGYEASSRCYDMNRIGNEVKNCGLVIPGKEDRSRQPKYWEVNRCSDDNLKCGRLWCSHENERVLRSSPQFEVEEVVAGHHCSAARFYLDWFLDDAGMVPNGSPCGYGKMCWRGVCIPSVHSDMGGCYCHGHGVCNNRGHCHCSPGFAPPNCTSLGNGGSVDSGPMLKYHLRSTLVVAGVLIGLILLATVVTLVTLIYHYNTRRWPPVFSKFKFLDYQKSESALETKEETKFENNYSKFVVPPVGGFNIHREVTFPGRIISRASRSSPTSPIPLIPDDARGSDIPPPRFIGERSPPVSPNPKKPSTVKSKAIAFERIPQGRAKPGPVVSHDKPVKQTLVLVSESQSGPPLPLCNKPGKPPPTSAKPKIREKTQSTPEGPPLLSSKPEKTRLAKGGPPLLSSKPEKIRLAPDLPRLLNSKPEKIRLAPDLPPLLSSKTSKTKPVPDRSGTGRNKDQISQPRLEQTTCTARTDDLPRTDQTLSRSVAPHKILRVDSHTAVKYLY